MKKTPKVSLQLNKPYFGLVFSNKVKVDIECDPSDEELAKELRKYLESDLMAGWAHHEPTDVTKTSCTLHFSTPNNDLLKKGGAFDLATHAGAWQLVEKKGPNWLGLHSGYAIEAINPGQLAKYPVQRSRNK